MPERMFEVLEGQKYTGRHRVYTEGQKFPQSELFGNDENHEVALNGSKQRKAKIKIVGAKKKKRSKKADKSDTGTDADTDTETDTTDTDTDKGDE